MRASLNRFFVGAVLGLLVAALLGVAPVQAGIYNSDADVTYKEYWVSHMEFTGGIDSNFPTRSCVPAEPAGNSFYLEPVSLNVGDPSREFFCEKTVILTIPDEMAGALKAEIYLDLWRNHAPSTASGALVKTSAIFKINDHPTWFESHPRGYDWSRTPIVTDRLRASDSNGVVIPSTETPVLSVLKKGQNTITFREIGGLYHLHDLAIRIYFDAAHPLLNPAGQPIQAPNGALKTIWHDDGLALATAGGDLRVDDDQLLITAEVATPAKFVEFHAFYRGYDEDNNDVDSDGGALDTDWHNLGRNNWHPGGTDPNVLGGTINHIGTVAATQPGVYAAYWDIPHILSQTGVKFKIRIVDDDNVVREAAGGVAGPFNLTRSRSMVASTAVSWADIGLHMSATITPARPATVTRTINLFGGLPINDFNEAYLVGAYWKTPYLALNDMPKFRVFTASEDAWALSVRKLPSVDYFKAGSNKFVYSHNSGFGEFIEKPGPLAILKQTTRQVDSAAPVIIERTPVAFLSDVDPATPIVVKVADPGRGVNAKTLKLWINGVQTTPQISGTPDEYTLAFTPPAPFPLNALVTVRVEACDYAAKCINLNNGLYTFRTLRGEYTLTTVPVGRGEINRTPVKSIYKYRDAVTLTASTPSGWAFTGWHIAQPGWADPDRRYRLPLRVAANGYARTDKPVETMVNFTTLLANLGETARFDPDTLRIVEVNAAGQLIDTDVPFQFDPAADYHDESNASGLLIFLLKGVTPATGVRDYHLYFDQRGRNLTPPSFPDLVVRSDTTDEGQESFRFATPNATWLYHKFGGGFSSLVDVDDNDWIGFHPTPNTGGGFFRGIPNLVPPKTLPAPYDGGLFHPGKNDVTTTSIASGPLRETIRSTTGDGGWSLQWEIFPSYPRMTMLQKPAGRSYWFLYEGTPGGEGECASRPCDLESDDFWTLPNGPTQSIYDPVGGDLSAPEWIYFSDPNVDGPSAAARSLFLIHHDDDLVHDAYYPFEDSKMTIFGFGRRPEDTNPNLTVTPTIFTVGLMDETLFDPASAMINGAYQALWVAHGGVQAQHLPGEATASPLLFRVSGNMVVTATFAPLVPVALQVDVVGDGNVTIDPDLPVYAAGDVVTVTATANPGAIFSHWSGDFVSDEAVFSFVIEQDSVLTANFVTMRLLNLTVEPADGGGQVVRTPDKSGYIDGEVVTLTAVTETGWRLVGWEGDIIGATTAATVTVRMDGDKTVNAHFEQIPYTLATAVSGSGAIIKTPEQTTYFYGDTVVLQAAPQAGWFFTAWSGDLVSGANPITLTVDGDKTLVANFADLVYTLLPTVLGGGAVTVSPAQQSYTPGASVTLSATAETGWDFEGWSGDLTGTANPATLLMDANKSITATFTQGGGYTLTIVPNGSGDVAVAPNQLSFLYGQIVSLTPQPAVGWAFVGWTGDLSGEADPAQLLIDGDKSIVANFAQNPVTLNTMVEGRGDLVISPQKSIYQPGETVTLLAVPDLDTTFVGWSEGASGTANPLALVMDSNKTVKATFADAPLPLGVKSDNFNRCTLNGAVWRFDNPMNDASYAFSGEQLVLTVPGGSPHDLWSERQAPSLLQNVENSDFELVAKFDSPLEKRYQLQGVIVQTDAASYLRANVQSDGAQVTLFVGKVLAGSPPSIVAHIPLPNFQPPYYLRVTRAGARWTIASSSDGVNWLTDDKLNRFRLPLVVTAVGPFAGNAIGRNSDQSKTPAHTAVVDFFFNTQVPLGPPEDPLPNHLPVVVVGDGAVSKDPTCGSPTSLTATSSPDWGFVGWSGALQGDASPAPLAFQTGDVVTATFTSASYLVDVGVVGKGAVTVDPAKPQYIHGERVTLTAIPAAGWLFDAWQGDATGNAAQLAFQVRSNLAVTATFGLGASGIVVPTSNGQVKFAPEQTLYQLGDQVTLEALANPGWVFAEWLIHGASDAASSTQNPLRIIIDGVQTYEPIFGPAGGAAIPNVYLPLIAHN